jgi:hypothetical protein
MRQQLASMTLADRQRSMRTSQGCAVCLINTDVSCKTLPSSKFVIDFVGLRRSVMALEFIVRSGDAKLFQVVGDIAVRYVSNVARQSSR